jgi:hypothetical protein
MALDTGLPEEPRHAPEGMQRGTRERVPLAKIVRKDRRNFISFVLHAHILRRFLLVQLFARVELLEEFSSAWFGSDISLVFLNRSQAGSGHATSIDLNR